MARGDIPEQQTGFSCKLRGVCSSPPTQDTQQSSQFPTTDAQRCLETLCMTPPQKHLDKSFFSLRYGNMESRNWIKQAWFSLKYGRLNYSRKAASVLKAFLQFMKIKIFVRLVKQPTCEKQLSLSR